MLTNASWRAMFANWKIGESGLGIFGPPARLGGADVEVNAK